MVEPNYKERAKNFLKNNKYNQLTPSQRVDKNNKCFIKIKNLVLNKN
jgi:hypothetical protein